MDETIVALGRELSGIPYENLTKRQSENPRGPTRIRRERREIGAGGTCFSLVNYAAERARELGLDPRFYLGDRSDGENRHCVIGFPAADVFLDPGYLCFEPLPLHPQSTVRVERPQNVLQLESIERERLEVHTERKNQLTWRYTLTNQPVSRDRFERAWRNSFNWESSMSSRVMTRLREDDMLLYLNGRLESISREERRRLTLPSDTNPRDYLTELFGVSPELVEAAELDLET